MLGPPRNDAVSQWDTLEARTPTDDAASQQGTHGCSGLPERMLFLSRVPMDAIYDPLEMMLSHSGTPMDTRTPKDDAVPHSRAPMDARTPTQAKPSDLSDQPFLPEWWHQIDLSRVLLRIQGHSTSSQWGCHQRVLQM